MRLKNNETGFGLTTILLGIVVLVAVGLSAYVLVHKNHDKTLQDQKKTADIGKRPSTKSPVDEYAGWKTYSNTQYGIAFRYPADWTTVEGGPNDDGSDPADLSVTLNFDSDQKYKEAAEVIVHTKNLAAITQLNDDMYAQATGLKVDKKELTLKGKPGVEYYIAAPTLPENLYLMGVGDKTYSFGSGIESSLQETTPGYRSDFAKTFDSLVIQ